MQTASPCRLVLARTDPDHNNGADVCPAIITRVWGSAERDGHQWTTVNLQLFRDSSAEINNWLTSVRLFADEAALKAWEAAQHPEFAAGGGVAYWPPRV